MLGVGRETAARMMRRLDPRRADESLLARVMGEYKSGSVESYARAVDTMAAQRLSFEEYVLELALLGLHGRTHTPDQYAAALGKRLRLGIRISVLSNAEFIRGSGDAVVSGGSLGRLIRIPNMQDVSVEVPTGLSPWLHQFTIAHELGHLAAAHPAPITVEGGELTAHFAIQPPRRRLARKPPLTSGLPPQILEDLYEAEADLRAQYTIVTASLGPVAVGTSRLTQIG